MKPIIWQSVVSLIFASLILSLINHTLAIITVTVGIGSAFSTSMILYQKRRYIRSLTITHRKIGIIIFIIIVFFSVIVSIVVKELMTPIISCLTISTFIPASFLPSITESLSKSNEMRFKPKIYSELLASLIVGLMLVLFYIGINIFGLSTIGGLM